MKSSLRNVNTGGRCDRWKASWEVGDHVRAGSVSKFCDAGPHHLKLGEVICEFFFYLLTFIG